MLQRLKDKVALVSGATSGIGKAIAFLFAEEGAKVVFCGRRQELGEAIQNEIRAKGGDCLFVRTDITNLEELKALVDETVTSYGGIDILVNNAGRSVPFRLEEMDLDRDYTPIFDLNIKSYFMLTSLAVRHMLTKGKGAIVNTASLAGIEGLDQYSSYCATKGAVIQFTKALAVEYASRGIRVNCLVPGLTNTELIPEGCDFEKLVLPSVPMGRSGKPIEIARAALSLASEESSYCTGVALVIDGGKSVL